MQKDTFLVFAIVKYSLAPITAYITYDLGSRKYQFWESERNSGSGITAIESGYNGGAVAFGIITAALIIAGSFFLYKHFEKNKPS